MAGTGQFKAVHNEWDIECKVWIGGLGEEGTRLELEEAFGKFGPVKNIWLAKNPPSFAFIEMEVSIQDFERAEVFMKTTFHILFLHRIQEMLRILWLL